MSSVTPESNTAPGVRQRSARGHGEQLRSELLDATLRLLAETGDPEDVSIRAAAKATGVSPTAVYRHFADRDALLEAACERSFDLFSAALLSEIDGEDDPFERLRLAGYAYLAYAERDPGLYRVLFSNPLHMDKDFTDEDSAGRTAFVVLIEMVQDCLDAGAQAAAHREPTDATYLAFQVWTWLHGIVDLRITHPGLPWPEARRMIEDLRSTLGLVAAGGASDR